MGLYWPVDTTGGIMLGIIRAIIGGCLLLASLGTLYLLGLGLYVGICGQEYLRACFLILAAYAVDVIVRFCAELLFGDR